MPRIFTLYLTVNGTLKLPDIINISFYFMFSLIQSIPVFDTVAKLCYDLHSDSIG